MSVADRPGGYRAVLADGDTTIVAGGEQTFEAARAAGETAPILFTAAIFSGATLPRGVVDSPVLALPYHIFVLAQDSLDPAAASELWAAAFLLVIVVFGLSLISLPLRLRTADEASHG